MASSTEVSVLKVLERAELTARERRLAASSEAEQIMLAAREQASAITARTAARVAEAIDDLRRRSERGAKRAIQALERDAAARGPARADPTATDPDFEQAAEMVVAAILGEQATPSDRADARRASRADREPGARL